MKQRFKITPAVYLILKKDDQILLMRRFNTGYRDGFYSLAAGHLDGGESLREALVREAKEEVGIDIKQEDLTFEHMMHLKSEIEGSNDDERMTFYFSTSSYAGVPAIMEPNKCDDLMWCRIDELPEKIIDHVEQALKKSYNKIDYSEFGWY